MSKYLTVLLLCFLNFTHAQNEESIQTDRPDQTETPSLVPKNKVQIETGLTFEKGQDSNVYTLPSVLWKYGVNENFELRLITEYGIEKSANINFNGFSPVLIGCKIKMAEEKGILPKTSFIGHIGLPNFASNTYKVDHVFTQFRFTMQHTLSENFSLSYNLGSEWDGIRPNPTFIYTLAAGYSINEKFSSYIEIFGFSPTKETTDHNIDGGITYLINNNFMVDLSAGIAINHMNPKNYVAFGFSFRI
jgi:hypothetical protein